MTVSLTETIGAGSYLGVGLQTNVGSAFTLLPGEYQVTLQAASSDWATTGIAEMQMLGADGAYIGLGGSEKAGHAKTTAVDSRGVVEVAGGTFKIAVTAPAANVVAAVGKIK